jgi:hypothetical protein
MGKENLSTEEGTCKQINQQGDLIQGTEEDSNKEDLIKGKKDNRNHFRTKLNRLTKFNTMCLHLKN